MKKSGGESVELNYEALGERINRIRKEKGITQSVLAERVVIEPSNTSHIERAASKVGLGTLVKIANALECTLSDLLCDSILCERVAFCLHQELPQRHQAGYPLICEVFSLPPAAGAAQVNHALTELAKHGNRGGINLWETDCLVEQPHRKLYVHNLIRVISARCFDFIGYCEKGENEKSVINCFVPQVRDTASGKRIVFSLVFQDIPPKDGLVSLLFYFILLLYALNTHKDNKTEAKLITV